MKKKTDEELGILLTREMHSMMFNEKLTAEQRVTLFCAIVSGKDVDDPLLSAFAESLKSGFIHTNNARKSAIYNRRERQRNYLRSSTPIDAHLRSSTPIDAHLRSSPIKGICKGICNIPLTPKGGKGEPPAISPESIIEGVMPREWAERYAADIASWYPYAVNISKLVKTLLDVVKKHSARAVEDGISRWRASGAWNEKRFVPRRIVAWIQGESFLDAPPQKSSGAYDAGTATGGGTAPSADATLRLLADEGE